MFYMSSAFNENLYWDMTNAKDISFMFAEASAFNGDVSSWQLFSVEKMMNVFEGAVRKPATSRTFSLHLLLSILNVPFVGTGIL